MGIEREFLTVSELAEELATTSSVVYGMRYRNEAPPAVKVGRELRFSRRDLNAWKVATATTGTRGRKAVA